MPTDEGWTDDEACFRSSRERFETGGIGNR
jgi:hypothetical protein